MTPDLMPTPRPKPEAPAAKPAQAAPMRAQTEDVADLAFIHVLWHRRWLILVLSLGFMMLGVFQLKRATPTYTSYALLKYEPAASQAVDFGERSRVVYSRDEIRTAAQLIGTPAIAAEVLAALSEDREQIVEPVVDNSPLATLRNGYYDLRDHLRNMIVSYAPPQVDATRLREQGSIRNLLSTLSVNIRPDTKLIELRVTMSDPARAERVLDEFCRQFIRRHRDERREFYSYAREYLSEQIERQRQLLEDAEMRLLGFSGQSDIRLMEGNREIALSTLRQINVEVERLRNEVAMLSAEADPEVARTMARQALATERQATLATLLARREELLVKDAELAAENHEDYLPLVRIRREREGIDAQIAATEAQFIDAFVGARQGALHVAQQRLAALLERAAEHQVTVDAIEQSMPTLRRYTDDIEKARGAYDMLSERFKRLEVSDEAAVGTVTIESPASIPTAPSSPNVTRTLMSFAMFGFCAGCGLVLLLHKMDRSVKDPVVIEQTLGLPALAFIPYLRAKRSKLAFLRAQPADEARMLAPFEAGRSVAGAEAFRYLRTSINYSSADTPCQILLVTSSLPGEGKSTVAANIGVFFAEQQRRVLLIDADLKKPVCHKTFGIPRMPGISDVLTGQADFNTVVHHTQFEGYDVLPAGLSTPSPATLLESRAMLNFLTEMRQRYDMVIIDSAPADGMADTLVLAKVVDGVVLTVRQGHTPTDVLTRVTEKLRGIGARVIGAAYNATEPAAFGSGYGYGYGYGYGRYYGKYTYGYGTEGRK